MYFDFYHDSYLLIYNENYESILLCAFLWEIKIWRQISIYQFNCFNL